MHVAFEASGIPADTLLSVRWNAGVAVDDFSNGINAWPHPMHPINADKFTFTSAVPARPPPPPPFDFEISGICADPAIEEMLYAQFEKLASWDDNMAVWGPLLVFLSPSPPPPPPEPSWARGSRFRTSPRVQGSLELVASMRCPYKTALETPESVLRA